MQRRQHPITISIVLVVVLAAGVFMYSARSIKLGLDLKGGLSVVLTAKGKVDETKMDQAELVIRNRVDKLGVAEASIQRLGDRNILVQLPGIKDPEKALSIIGKTALLEFKIYSTDAKGKVVLGPTLMTGDSVEGANVSFDEMGKPVVEIQFSSEGAQKFADITSKYVKKQLAIILDKKIITHPNIEEPILGGKAQITGIGSVEEAKNIALVLQTGRLPVELSISEQRTVGPTLGQDSLLAGLRAGIIGLVLVVGFMLLMYRGMGLITVVALAMFTTVFLGIISLLGYLNLWALTLPGIAGIILSIGVAADSSIILYERVKEEVRGGRSFRSAADTGFVHALRTLIDADLTTFVSAAALFVIGIGPVRGFALTLMLGMAIDWFTFVMFTRAVLGIVAQKWPRGSVILGVQGGGIDVA